MAEISFSGLGSGIDFGVVRDAIIAQRSVPITRLQSKVGNYNNRIESLKQLNTALAALTSAAQTLTNRELGTGRNAVTGDNSIATASATSAASLGGFNINVSRLATSLTQSSRSYSSATEPILFGGATTATFELRTGGVSPGTEITIDATNNTLEGLRDAINSSGAGITASIVDLSGDGTQQQIVLSSGKTGAVNRVELVETSSTGTGGDLNLRSLNPPDGDFSKLDAALSVNGLDITRPTNSISDAVAGVNITLKKTGSTSITITQSTDIENKLRGFVTAYNTIQDAIAGQYKLDSSNRPTGVLAGDPTLRNIQQQLKNVINTISESNGGVFNSLSQIGITTSQDGKLALDSTVLNAKLATNLEDVRSLLYGKTESQTGIFQKALEISGDLSNDITGSVQTAITGYQSSISSLNDNITRRLESLNRLRQSLTLQFAAADAAIGQINSQGTALTSIIKSLEPRNNY